MARLADEDMAALAKALPAWQVDTAAGCLRRRFRFVDFSEAWGFMSRVALLAEAQDHHPDWSNSWNTVEISLTTHAAKGLTARDSRLAEAIDRLRPE